jgi:hypothetical protein
MRNSPLHKGVGVHWGVSSTGIAGLGTFTLTSNDHGRQAARDSIQDPTGFTVNVTYYDYMESANLSVVITGSLGSGNVTPSLPEIGDVVTITDSVYTALSGSNWLLDSVSTSRSNTSAMRASYGLTRYGKLVLA